MKAKIKGTNKVVDVNKKVNPHASHVNDYIFIDDDNNVFTSSQLDFNYNSQINWDVVKIKISITAMHALIEKFNWSEEKIAQEALKQANVLIDCLKNEIL